MQGRAQGLVRDTYRHVPRLEKALADADHTKAHHAIEEPEKSPVTACRCASTKYVTIELPLVAANRRMGRSWSVPDVTTSRRGWVWSAGCQSTAGVMGAVFPNLQRAVAEFVLETRAGGSRPEGEQLRVSSPLLRIGLSERQARQGHLTDDETSLIVHHANWSKMEVDAEISKAPKGRQAEPR